MPHEESMIEMPDIEFARTLFITAGQMGSLFISSGAGFCMEVDEGEFLRNISSKFGLISAVAQSITTSP
jgi:hypothetical protein